MRLLLLAALLAQPFLSLPAAAADKILLSGTVRDFSSSDPLPAAHIRLLGTSRGTIANNEGRYTLLLEPGRQIVVVSMLGYRPDTLRLELISAGVRDVALTATDIVMPEVVVTSEDPAFEIIRRAIAAKKLWIRRLLSYDMDAFTRQTLRRDTSIASITESFTRGYWQEGDTLREVLKQRRQTANIAAGFNFASVGRILNFNEDQIRFVGYTFVAPIAIDALDYYDYKLLRTRIDQGHEIYDIQLNPRTRSVPLFSGTVHIAGDTYALVGIDVQPNEAFLIPFVKEKRLRYRQEFQLYDREFWMPSDIRINASFTLGIPGISFPRFSFDQTSVIYDYRINQAIPDSIFRRPRLVVDSAATKFDSTFWATSTVLPLGPEEQHAYEVIDTSQTLEVQFRPGGAVMTLGGDGGSALPLLSVADVSFNRVEGLHLGAQGDFKQLSPFLVLNAGLAYGFSNRMTSYVGGATIFTSERHTLGFGAEVFRRVDHRPDEGYYGPLFNTVTALLAKNDYRDYYRAEGWSSSVSASPAAQLKLRLSFVSELERSLAQRSNYSLIYPSRDYRVNPSIEEGALRSLRFDLRVGDEAVPFDMVWRNALELSIEHSSPAVIASDFTYTRYKALVSYALETFGRGFLLKPVLRIRAAMGTSSGTLPAQRLFNLESASSGFAPFGVMRGMDVKEFSGTGYVALNIEHNFRSIPFLALGIPFLYENNIEILVHGGAARTWNKHAGVPATQVGWYSEAGFGISRILEFIRADCTWRLSAPRGFAFSLGVAAIL